MTNLTTQVSPLWHAPTHQFLYWNPFFCPLSTLLSVFPTSMNPLPSLCSVLWVGSLGDNHPTLVSFNQKKRVPVLSPELKIMEENKCRNCKSHPHPSQIIGQHISTDMKYPQCVESAPLLCIIWHIVSYLGGRAHRNLKEHMDQNNHLEFILGSICWDFTV